MFKVFAIMVLCATSSVHSATMLKRGPITYAVGPLGIVSPVFRCGGVGTPMNLRISECEGRCQFRPGTLYNCEKDFMPSSAASSLTLKIEICMSSGFCMVILQTELVNSSVQPGFVYTAKYSIVPNDILAGQTVEFKAHILHTDNLLEEICMSADVDILEVVQ